MTRLNKLSKYKPKTQRLEELTEEELYQRFTMTIGAIIIILAILVSSFVFFAPKIGSLFGLISVNRKDLVVTDVLAPFTPYFIDPPVATSSDTVTLTGSAEPGSTVKLFVNGPERQTTLADLGGVFTFTEIQLNQGRNTIFVRAVDSAGNESDNSNTIIIQMDKEKPEIKIVSPISGDTIKNLDRRIFVTGSINEKANIKVNERLAVQKPDLTFEFLLGVEEGDIKITVEATDLAGNTKIETINVKYERTSN